jgi:hypothetical protein
MGARVSTFIAGGPTVQADLKYTWMDAVNILLVDNLQSPPNRIKILFIARQVLTPPGPDQWLLTVAM